MFHLSILDGCADFRGFQPLERPKMLNSPGVNTVISEGVGVYVPAARE
jgi:hypothetical protein